MRKCQAKWQPKQIRANSMKIQNEKYRHQVRELSRVLYDFYARRKPAAEIQFEDLETRMIRPKRRAA